MTLPSRVLTGLLLSLLLTEQAAAADVNTNACQNQVYDALAHEERVYKSVLFGQKASQDLPINSVRFDKEGNSWIKTGDNAWNSLDAGYEHTTWSNTLMDTQGDTESRRGIFEVKKAMTSQLIPPLLQSVRALQCRMRAVCMLQTLSQNAKDKNNLTVQPDGCIAFNMKPLTSCKTDDQQSVGTVSCDNAVDSIMERETQLLTMVVAYDAAYRSLLQFGGLFEGFLGDIRFPLLQPLWQTVRVIGGLNHMPCFLSQCNE